MTSTSRTKSTKRSYAEIVRTGTTVKTPPPPAILLQWYREKKEKIRAAGAGTARSDGFRGELSSAVVVSLLLAAARALRAAAAAFACGRLTDFAQLTARPLLAYGLKPAYGTCSCVRPRRQYIAACRLTSALSFSDISL